MKIMFYINTISHGGAERVMVNLANQLSEKGHDCILVTSFRTPAFEYHYNPKVFRISLTEGRIQYRIMRNFKYTYLLRKAVKQHKPDALIAFMPEANNRSIIATRLTRTKTIISVRNDPNKEYGNRLYRILARTLYRAGDGVVFQTEDAKKWFPLAIQKKGAVIFNQVDNRFYQEKYDGPRHNIVAVGRLTAQKNHRMLIDAYANISGCGIETMLIYGDGPLKEELQKQINECGLEGKIILKGNVEDVSGAIKSAKLYVLSSDYEGMPNSLMEAMALGVPCISTDCPCGGPRSLFDEELSSCLVPVNDTAAMGMKIRELMNDEKLLETIGYLARQRAEFFKPDVIINNWECFINKVVKDKTD